MRVFVASLATETNTFSPIRTDRRAFEDALLAGPGQHPATPTLCSAPFVVARRRAAAGAFTLIEGTAAWAEPGGLVTRRAHEELRDRILGELRDAGPVDVVLFGLHGAMVAEGCDDCEGDLLSRARAIVGRQATIGAELDPHCHLTAAMLAASDVLVAFKEVPHTDFVARAEDLVDLCLRRARGEIVPVMSVVDCRTISPFLTNREPGRSLVERIRSIEGRDGILDISVVHGFPAADVHDVGSKVIVITDARPQTGLALAFDIARRIRAFGANRLPPMPPPREAVEQAMRVPGAPVVLADRWDNPGGGVPGDSTFLVHELLAHPDVPAAAGALWDPEAVRACVEAGVGSRIHLRFGARSGAGSPVYLRAARSGLRPWGGPAGSGEPADATVEITAALADLVVPFQQSRVSLGAAVAVRIGRLDVVLASRRVQTYHPDVFGRLGIEVTARKIVVVKSASHFHPAFAPIAAAIIHVDCGGPFPPDPARIPYTRIRRPIAPLDPGAAPVAQCQTRGDRTPSD